MKYNYGGKLNNTDQGVIIILLTQNNFPSTIGYPQFQQHPGTGSHQPLDTHDLTNRLTQHQAQTRMGRPAMNQGITLFILADR